ELIIQELPQPDHEIDRRQRGREERNTRVRREIDDCLVEHVVLGQEDAGHLELCDVRERTDSGFQIEVIEILVLGITDDLHALMREQVEITSQGESGPVQGNLGNLPICTRDVVDALNVHPDRASKVIEEELHRDELLLEDLWGEFRHVRGGLGDFYGFENPLDDGVARHFLGFGFVGDGDAVTQDVEGNGSDVLGGNISAVAQESMRPRCEVQIDGCTGRSAIKNQGFERLKVVFRRPSGRHDQVNHVLQYPVVDVQVVEHRSRRKYPFNINQIGRAHV